MRISLLLLVLATATAPAHAITRPLLAGLQDLLPYQLNALAPALDDLAPAREAPVLPYAVAEDVDLDSRRDGRWLQRDGHAVWRLRLRGDDALSLSASLGPLNLPIGTIIRIADGSGEVHSEHFFDALRSLYQTPIVPGQDMVLEVELPAGRHPDAFIAVRSVQQGYRDIRQRRKSGSCNIDTACPEANAWTEAVRATARITINGTSLCSAVLLNNTENDGRPLLLTANHCGLTPSNAAATVVYWNFETSECGGTPDGSLGQSQSGATLLASNPDPDFSLLELDRTPPSSFSVYYAGWDSRGNGFPSGAGVHHPAGDEKRISLFDRSPRKTRALVDGDPVQSWQVFWSAGVTEPGSSGSGLFDNTGRVVGQLSGGNSSCDNPGGSDVYGRMDFGWDNASSDQRNLQPWLAPGSTQRVIDGRDSAVFGARARDDAFVVARGVRSSIPLPVLLNDSGPRPLRIVDASSSQGQLRVDGNRLLYTPATDDDAVIEYLIIDRDGSTSRAQAKLRPSARENVLSNAAPALRGGSLDLTLMLLGLAGLICRSRRRPRPA